MFLILITKKIFGDSKPFPNETLEESCEDATDEDWKEFAKLNLVDLRDAKSSLRIAKLEYEHSNLKLIELRHAISHIAVFINAEPNNPEGYALLDKIIEHYAKDSESKDILDLAPVDKEQNNSWDRFVARAYIQGEKKDNFEDAFWLLFNAQVFYSQVQLLGYWVMKWIKKHGVKKVCSAECFEQAMLVVNSSFSNESSPTYEAEKKKFLKFLALIDLVVEEYPENARVLGFASSYYRKIGQHQKAISLGDKALKLDPKAEELLIFQAINYRSAGDLDKSLELYAKIMDVKSNNIGVLIDVGDLYYQNGELDKAANLYYQALKQDGNHPWALPSYYFMRYLIADDSDKESWYTKITQLGANDEKMQYTLSHQLKVFEKVKEKLKKKN